MTDLYVDQGDDEIVNVGPIIGADGNYLAVPAGYTTTLVVKANKTAADASGITYAGTFVAAVGGGETARFTVPKADLAILGSRWYRCRVIDGAGLVQTASAGRFIVDTGRGNRSSGRPTGPPALYVEDGGSSATASTPFTDGGMAA